VKLPVTDLKRADYSGQ